MTTIRVVFADDETMLRSALRTILDSHHGIDVVGEAADGRQAVEQAHRLLPDVVVMDVRMPNLDGIEATRALVDLDLDPPARILMLTTFDLDEYVYAALRAGAAGFILKDAPPHELVHAIRVVAAGDSMLAPTITRRLIQTFASQPAQPDGQDDPGLKELTEREIDVLKLVARGHSNADIAAALTVTQATVKTHVGRILTKLGLANRVQAAVFAYEAALVQLGGGT
jgi:DNA-binding NarL/FixJ family response regulator